MMNGKEFMTLYQNPIIDDSLVDESRTGTLIHWFKNGIVKEHIPLLNGKSHGIIKTWDHLGGLAGRYLYINDVPVHMNEDKKVSPIDDIEGKVVVWDAEVVK